MTTDSTFFSFLLQLVPALNTVYSQINAFKPFQPQLIGRNSFYIVTKQYILLSLCDISWCFLYYFLKYQSWHTKLICLWLKNYNLHIKTLYSPWIQMRCIIVLKNAYNKTVLWILILFLTAWGTIIIFRVILRSLLTISYHSI